VLAFVVAEWFHDPAFAGHLSPRHWRRLESRVAAAVERALALCAAHGATATFFVLGAIAERHPGVVAAIANAGHEVASLGWLPRDLGAVPATERPAALAELERARAAIEAATGIAVRGFRAPWPTAGARWWRVPLGAEGYAYEASDAAVVRLDGRAASAFDVHCCRAADLDADQPRLVGLPARVLRAHAEALPRTAAELAAVLAHGTARSFATTLALAAEPAPPRPARAAPPGATVASPSGVALARVAIVVPLKDEEAGLPSLLVELDNLDARLRRTGVCACEFVFVDDGSTDRTWPLLQERLAARAGVHLVRHAHNQGVAAAIRSGMSSTDAPVVASIDGDLSYDPAEIARMLPLLAGADLVTASPYHRAGGVKNVPGWRLALSRTLSWCYRRLLRSDVRTWTSCFRLYRRAAVVDLPLQNPGFLGTAELLVRVLRAGGVVREHPCVLEARLFGSSKMKVLRTIRGHLRLLWQVARGRLG